MQWLTEAVSAIERLRNEGGHLHSVTNTVAQNFTANVLLACGATVAMTANAPEMESFVSCADALHINLGTLDEPRMAAIDKAVSTADKIGLPILVDPVMVEASALRQSYFVRLAPCANTLRCNQQEAQALGAETEAAVCKIVTGELDKIEYQGQTVSVHNGTPKLTQTIATGCALGALIAILNAKTDNPAAAALGGLLWFNIAGELAAINSAGPGSFAVALIDGLHSLTPRDIRTKARLS